MVGGGWWAVSGGWWLVAGGWWLVAGSQDGAILGYLLGYLLSTILKLDAWVGAKSTGGGYRGGVGQIWSLHSLAHY